MANKNLTNAKRVKNDEFYTQYSDIQKEIEAYLEYDADVFRGKVVYCNCDDRISGVFTDVESEMRGLEWGRLYEEYHKKAYNPAKVSAAVRKFYGNPYIKNRRGIFEYILGGSVDTKLLEVRVFDEAVKRSTYELQTAKAEKKGESNCPLCAVGHDANKGKIWNFGEMDADHVAAWSRGGATAAKNCQMLCKTHNRAKGNR
jgi:5-methylcytosine-specific restriction endonuclease McrA